ncbi:MAG: non-heme iron oxygenase ferredoxin subunit [Anaerolineales bacterium]|nr:non-heme iron oxygenase ferredoxin subunit [Anaerolineales bacterium]
MTLYDRVDPSTAEYVAVATVDELPNGARKIVEVDGKPIAIFNIAGTLYAIADVCSHDDGPVAEGDLYGYEIECPRHGARFDVRTGKVLSFPAIVDIPAYPVKIENGEVLVGLPPAE